MNLKNPNAGREFFCVCPIGAERFLLSEIEEVLPFLIAKDGREFLRERDVFTREPLSAGGVTVSLPLEVGLQLNYWLRLATRVLLRLGSFRATEPWQFKKGLDSVLADSKFLFSDESWGKVQSGQVSWKISSQTSKLGNEKFLMKLVNESLGLQKKPEKKPETNPGTQTETKSECKSERKPEKLKPQAHPPKLFIRGDSDHFEISIDTSGEPLFHRGVDRIFQSQAPIRENMAALLIQCLVGDSSAAKLSQVNLADPFCGSGTLLFEALNFKAPLLARLNKPEGSKNGPGFAFQRDLRLPKLLISEHFFKNYLDSSRGQVGRQSDKGQSGSLSSKSSIKFRGVYGYDLNPEAGIFRLSDPWKDLIWASSDWSLFVAKIGELTSAQLWIATNPPYGVRLKALPEKEFIQKCLELNPNRVAWIAEQGYSLKVLSQWPKEGWEAKKIRVLNQGLPCFICVMSALGR